MATDRAVRVREAFTNYFTTHHLVTKKLQDIQSSL